MAHFLRVMRATVWFLIGFASVAVLALRMETAEAVTCAATHATIAAFQQQCDFHQNLCNNNPQTRDCGAGSCDYGGQSRPACWISERYQGAPTPYQTSYHGFVGACPAADTPGPSYNGVYGSGGPPATQCSGPCQTRSNGVEVCVPRADGSQQCAGESEYTGDACVTSSNQPDIANPAPETCSPEQQTNGECPQISDGDSNPNAPPVVPQICIGVVCRDLPPSPNAASGCTQGDTSALCTGDPNAASAPAPGQPYPPGQAPNYSSSASTPSGPVPFSSYGPAQDGNAGPPDSQGNCPSGTTNQGGSCMCPSGEAWNGTACYDADGGGDEGEGDGVCDETEPNDPDCEGDGREGEFGTCGEAMPACTGDEIDCAIMHQTWATRCALTGTEDAPGVDLDSDPLAEYGGADGLFSEADEVGPGALDEGGFLGNGGCPQMPSISVLGYSLTISPVWCELWWLGTLLVSLAYLSAIRIVYGD